MSDLLDNNKKIAKNTSILYVRMLVLMVISLYTSRIVLNALGEIDYGLYNVVGGVVVAIGFLTGTLNTTSSRFITVALAENSAKKLRIVFNNILFVSCIFALLVVFIGETFGLWFLYNKLNIPSERFTAALWVYHLSILTVAISIISSAYNACIIAHEKMTAFAYITLVDGISKLLIGFLLMYELNVDKLILYAISLCILQIVDRLIYGYYCKKNFPETRIQLKLNKKLLWNIFKFISWSSYGSFVSIGFTQGLNILLNIFFGPAVNSARALSVQVQNAIVSFAFNFQTAINPQLTQSVAKKNFRRATNLLITSSKYSFFLLCILGIPIILEADFILRCWLKNIPIHTVQFVQLMILISILSTFSNPLRIINQAEGQIKKFQLYECSVLLLIVPISYITLIYIHIPELVFIIHLFIEIIASFIRLKIVLPKISLSLKLYIKSVYIPSIAVAGLSLFIGYYIKINLNFESNILYHFIFIITLCVIIVLVIYLIGINRNERLQLRKIISKNN